MKRVLLAGEGPTELGDWWNEVPYRAERPELAQRGVLEALLLRRARAVFVIEDGVRWTKVRLYRAGDHRGPEARRIRGLAVLAEERHCDVLVFSRDRDGDEERESQLEEGIAEAERNTAGLAIVGGCAVEAIEAWLLALLGERRSEEHTDPKAKLRARNECRTAAERSELIEKRRPKWAAGRRTLAFDVAVTRRSGIRSPLSHRSHPPAARAGASAERFAATLPSNSTLRDVRPLAKPKVQNRPSSR